jgi:hypothetical protein
LFRGDAGEEAFHAGRPTLAWATWALSLGQRPAVPWVLAALSILGTGALVAATGALARALDHDTNKVLLVVALPGSIVTMCYVGLADGWATAAVMVGFVLWHRGRYALAAAVFALAILTRETGLIAVGALMLVEWRDRKRLAALALSALPYAAWLVIVRLRLGTWSFAATSANAASFRYSYPGGGLLKAIGDWSLASWLCAGLIVVFVVLGLRGQLPRELRLYMLLWIGAASAMGVGVWETPLGWPRVLLPLTVVCLVSTLPSVKTDTPALIARQRTSTGTSVAG